MENFNKLIKEALTPDFLKESVYDDPIKKKAEQRYRNQGGSVSIPGVGKPFESIKVIPKGEYTVVEGDMDGRYSYPRFNVTLLEPMKPFDLAVQLAQETGWISPWNYLEMRTGHNSEKQPLTFPLQPTLFDEPLNENKSIYDPKINQLPKEIQDALKGEWEDDDFEDVTVYYHERGPKEGTGYVNFAMFNPSAGDELHKSLTKAGLKLDPLRSFQDGNFIKVYLNESINEASTKGIAKIEIINKLGPSTKLELPYDSKDPNELSRAIDLIKKSKNIKDVKILELIKESINEAKELTQDDIYNFLKPKFKDTKRATYKVDKVGKQVVVSWKITKTGYKDSKGDLFVDLDDMDFTSNYGSGKNWNTKAQLLSGLKKFIRDDAKSIHG